MNLKDSCWCGSGKVFEQCHFGRAKEKTVSKGEAIRKSKKIASRKSCNVPAELSHECDKKIINAHTISKSGSLIAIADKTNHVLGLRIDLPNLIKNNGELVPERIGVKQASTFKGFCAKHDKQLFSCLEDLPFTSSDEQCFALMYRSLTKELYAKEGALITSDFLKGADKGRSLFEQIFIQDFTSNNELGVNAAITELSALKKLLDDHLLGNRTLNMSHLVIDSLTPIPVVVSSFAAPIMDFAGNYIQNLGDLSVVAEYVSFNSFSSGGKGYVVFSWLSGSSKIETFIHTLLSINKAETFSALVKFFFGIAENTFVSPDWWKALSNSQQEEIKALIMTGANPFTFEQDAFFTGSETTFTGWTINKMTRINF